MVIFFNHFRNFFQRNHKTFISILTYLLTFNYFFKTVFLQIAFFQNKNNKKLHELYSY